MRTDARQARPLPSRGAGCPFGVAPTRQPTITRKSNKLRLGAVALAKPRLAHLPCLGHCQFRPWSYILYVKP
jgi:hypothetical protein